MSGDIDKPPVALVAEEPADALLRNEQVGPTVPIEITEHGGHAARAIMEAVAFALADQARQVCGDRLPSEIRSCGGAARSNVWLQIKADVLNVPVATTACPEPTSLGAAMLAARALGWGTLPALAQSWVRTNPPHRPDPQIHAIYKTILAR